jgi:hypothetical protein
MSTPTPEELGEAIGQLVPALEVPARVEAIVRLAFPGGHVDEIPMESPHLAAILAHTLARDWRECGITVQTTALTQTWILVDETEITDPLPRDDDQ